MANNENRKKQISSEERVLKRRRRSVLIVMVEIVFCLILSIGCYGVNLLNSYAYEELDKDVYIEQTTRPKETQIVTSIVEETNESGEVIGTSAVEVASTSLTGYRNILVVGLDARSQAADVVDGVNSDVMIIVSINNDTGEIKMVSILRDTILKMEEGTSSVAYNKANDQFSLSGISDTVSMVNRNLGLDIEEYIIVNWYGVAVAVNQLGGIELTIPNETILNYFNGYLTATNEATGLWAPQLPTPGTYLMSGTQVVAFCRIRYGGYNDDGRTNNQREAIEKLFNKAKEYLKLGEINTILNVAETALDNVKTNLTLPEILFMATDLSSYSMAGSTQFPQNYTTGRYVGNYAAKYNVLDPLVATNFEQEVKNLHAFLFNDPNYECSDFIKNISYQMYLDTNGL